MTEMNSLPTNARRYIEFLSQQIGTEIGLVSTGPERMQTIIVQDSALGTWLRDQFHTGGCDFSACTPPEPFEGFDFRSSDDVRFKSFMLDAYYERDSDARRRAEMEERGLTVSDAHTILYDDVVVATERIGCRR